MSYVCSNQISVMLLYWHKFIFLENQTHAIHKKREKVEVLFAKVLIHNQKYFIKKFFSTHCMHFYLIFCFHSQRSDFIAYVSLCAKYVIKIFQKKNMKNEEIVYIK